MYLNKNFKRYIFFYFIILISIVVVSTQLKLLFIPMNIVFIYLINKYREYRKELLLILIVMTPLSALKPIYTVIFDFPQMFIFTYLLNEIARSILSGKKRFKINTTLVDILYYLMIIIVFLSFIWNDIEFKVKFIDFRVYLSIIIIFCIYRRYKGMNKFYNMITLSTTLCSCITLIIYMFGDIRGLGLLAIEGRYTWGYQTLYIITIPFLIFNIFNATSQSVNNLIYLIFALVIQGIGMILGQNRTGIALTIIFIIILFIYSLVRYSIRRGGQLRTAILIFLIPITMICVGQGIKYGIKNNNKIIMRFMDIVNKTGTINNLTTRNNTNEYYKEDLMLNPLGHGIGTKMYMYSYDNTPYQFGYFIDNAFLTLGYKMGVPILIIVFLIIFITIVKNIAHKKKNFLYKYSIATILLLCVAGGIMTAQILNNNAVSFTFWSIIGIITRENYVVNEE